LGTVSIFNALLITSGECCPLVVVLEKKKIILPLLAIGLFLILSSWFVDYPISVNSPSDFLPNHISPLFWVGVSTVCAALYITAMLSKRSSLKCVATLGIILFIYSSAYLFWFMPGPDSFYFRGLTENFDETGVLDYQEGYHGYYQWPVFFVFNKIAYSLGLDLRLLEFILFGLFGIFYGVSLYSLFHKSSKDGAFFAVLSYFILIWWYFDYYAVPFALGFGFLLLLFMLDSYGDRKPATMLTMLIIFICMTLTHSFAPIFFVFYAFIKSVLNRDRKYLSLALLTLVIYSAYLTFRAEVFLKMGIEELFGLGSYTAVTFGGENLIVAAANPIDEMVQMISRAVFIVTGLVAGTGFIILFFKKRLEKTNLSLVLLGGVFLAGSIVLPILGTRALQILFVPLSLGVVYYQETKFKRYFQGLFLILIILFVCTPIHTSFNQTSKQIMYQTEADYKCANFLLDYYRPSEKSLMGTDVRMGWYIVAKLRSPNVTLGNSLYHFFMHDLGDYSCILNTISLEKVFLSENYTVESAVQMDEYSIFYSCGSSQVLVKRK
jgi:hypothetical protein